MKNYFRLLTTVSLLVLLSACSTPSSISKEGTTDNPVWPQLTDKVSQGEDSYGTWPNLDNVKLLERGMIKSQIYYLLNEPHFKEGIGVREWDYLFNFRVNGEHHICQFKILFDSKKRAQSFYWLPVLPKDGVCPPQLTQSAKVLPPKVLELNTDTLFTFDGAGLKDILAEGRERLDKFIPHIKEQNLLNQIIIVAHTDYLGTNEYNLNLSQRRAETIRQYLIASGIPANIISAHGEGESQPIKQCSKDLSRTKLIDCLTENRRAEIFAN